MDDLTIVTAAGKTHFVLCDSRNQKRIVRRQKVVTTTGSQVPHCQHKRQQFFLTLAGTPAR